MYDRNHAKFVQFVLKTHLHKDGGAVGRQLVCERLQDEVREGLLVLEPPVNARQILVDG